VTVFNMQGGLGNRRYTAACMDKLERLPLARVLI
jgi:hypothetical protein